MKRGSETQDGLSPQGYPKKLDSSTSANPSSLGREAHSKTLRSVFAGEETSPVLHLQRREFNCKQDDLMTISDVACLLPLLDDEIARRCRETE